MAKPLPFKISTGLKSIIGKELITDDFIAIFELVKNSFDARARRVTVEFIDLKKDPTQSKILIIDNGDGMSYDDILKKWLFVGFSIKKEDAQDKKMKDYRWLISSRKRVSAGSKGVGRFSADRLGAKLDLYTKTAEDSRIHRLEIDWKKFESDQNQEFHDIQTFHSALSNWPSEYPELAGMKKGTVLEISSLNGVWDKEKLVRLKKTLQRLVNPSTDPDSEEFQIQLVAKEFEEDDKHSPEQEIINGKIRNIVFEKLKIKTTQLLCTIKNDEIVTVLNDKGRKIFQLKEKNTFNKLVDVTILISFLNKEAKAEFTRRMGVPPGQYGSIFLYKNGFRVYPYGEPGDDWLKLERRKSQGYARYLSAREIIGRIEVYGSQSDFREISSREGLVETEAVTQLKDAYMELAHRRLERYLGEIDWDKSDEERKKKTPDEIRLDTIVKLEQIIGKINDPKAELWFHEGLLDILGEREIKKPDEALKSLEGLVEHVKSGREKQLVMKQIGSLRTVVQRLRKESKEKDEIIATQQRQALFLESEVSSDSLQLRNLVHALGFATTEIEKLLDLIDKEIKKTGAPAGIVSLIQQVRTENRKAHLLEEVGLRANFDARLKMKEDIVFYVKQYVERVLNSRKGDPLTYRVIVGGNHFNTSFSAADVAIILDNFISNSRKANSTFVTVAFEPAERGIRMYIADNGKGVQESSQSRLFQRGFTTTGGSGIGLSHVKSIVEKMGGTVKFVGNNFKNLGKGACFEVSFS